MNYSPVYESGGTPEEENFAESWVEEPLQFDDYVRFIRSFHSEMQDLTRLEGLDVIGDKLKTMFGEDPTTEALRRHADHLLAARKSGELGFTAAGLTTSVGGISSRVPQHTPYGDAE